MLDVIGDLHSCHDELLELIHLLGYERTSLSLPSCNDAWFHPENRKIIFTGDLADRGPKPVETYNLVKSLIKDDMGFCVQGNHDFKLFRYLKGNPIKISHGLQDTIDQLGLNQINNFDPHSPVQLAKQQRVNEIKEFLQSLPYKIETESLIVVHGAYKINKKFKHEKELALYGDVDRKFGYDLSGNPIRLNNWKSEYLGFKDIVVGHSHVDTVECYEAPNARIWNIDTGCVFGNKLSALRLPEGIVFEIKAKKNYWR